ncbi:MAG: RdgB/HAM1 family non-canonical purine NTP pyrophosphatase [Steroidobacteraceae bacterium]
MQIRVADFDHPSLRELLHAHLDGMRAHSPPGHVHALDLSGLQRPDVALFMALEGDVVVGMGALRALDARHGEIKSMRTRDGWLRRGVAAQLLEHLLAVATARGYRRVSLETGSGTAFEPALALYRRRGFVSGPAFGDYVASDFNQFMHLDLLPSARRPVVLATGNRGKLAEFRQLLGDSGFDVVPQSQFGIDPPEETGTTFEANAELKARHAARLTGLPALADDSGLEVDALGGAPGVYSARYAGAGASDAANIAKLLAALAAVPDAQRTARFRCVIACVRTADDPAPLLARGAWEGRILAAPRGSGGFGYDPVFLDPASGSSAAELDAAAKNARSHRGAALRDLLAQLRATAA